MLGTARDCHYYTRRDERAKEYRIGEPILLSNTSYYGPLAMARMIVLV
jgi:hypothetical protein